MKLITGEELESPKKDYDILFNRQNGEDTEDQSFKFSINDPPSLQNISSQENISDSSSAEDDTDADEDYSPSSSCSTCSQCSSSSSSMNSQTKSDSVSSLAAGSVNDKNNYHLLQNADPTTEDPEILANVNHSLIESIDSVQESNTNTHDDQNASLEFSDLIDEVADLSGCRKRKVVKKSEKKNTRKRLRHESSWIKNKAKKLRCSGQTYVSSAKSQKIVKARKLQEPCSEQCKFKCTVNINNIQRQEIFDEFYKLGDVNHQRDFIARRMKCIKPKYRYVREKCRRLNNAFYFKFGETEVRVCKHFFKSTLDINDRVISTVIKKQNEIGVVELDRRGKHNSHPKISDAVKDSIRSHINSIPRMESHYLRKQTSKEFIEGGKTIADLHRDYVRQCEVEGKPSANYHMYNDIFNSEFNISFFVPRIDQCNVCFKYENSSNEEKEIMKIQFHNHQEEKKLSRDEKENDKKNSNQNFIVCCYDLQAMMQLPKGDVNIFYYKSKLNTLNFTV